MRQWARRSIGPRGPRATLSDSTPAPWRPARTMPAGDSMLVTASGGWGSWYGRSCSTASVRENQSDRYVYGVGSVMRRMITSSASAIIGRRRDGSMPSMRASVR